MKISRLRAHRLDDVPMQPPPLRDVPNSTSAVLIEVETDDGLTGWSLAGFAHVTMADFVNNSLAEHVIGADPLRTGMISATVTRQFSERQLGRVLTSAWSAIDIALWDVKGKALGLPVHVLLGGTVDEIPVYITHGVPYAGGAPYSMEELTEEAAYLASAGHRFLKIPVCREPIPDPDEGARRMAAVRAAIGPGVQLAMDGGSGMSLAQAIRLCRLTDDLDIAFLEEPVVENDPQLLAQLRQQTRIPIAVAANHRYSARDLLLAQAVDILQPNANNDGGYTGGVAMAALAKAFNVPIGHGNGSGPANIALQAGVPNGTIIEYHLNRWNGYNAIFQGVPQPHDGMLTVSTEPGTGMVPVDGLIDEFGS